MNGNSKMLTGYDVAQLLNVNISTVRKWSNKGTLKAYRIGPRGDRRFRLNDVMKILVPNSGLYNDV
jgi:excisionase family DNA binding protein